MILPLPAAASHKVVEIPSLPKSYSNPPKHIESKLHLKHKAVPASVRKLTVPKPQSSVHTTYVKPVASPHGCGDNSYARFIYMHESGCSTTATNANGCYGIGQDCNGIVRSRCGADYACQNDYFASYANSRYGSWQAAYNYWQQNHWW